jgi:hypothetical protein
VYELGDENVTAVWLPVFGLKSYDLPSKVAGATSFVLEPPPPHPLKNPVNTNPAANAANLQSFPVLMFLNATFRFFLIGPPRARANNQGAQ